MIEGIYRVAFTGMNGSGLGILLLKNGALAGADVSGGTFDGTYEETADKRGVLARWTTRFPAGATPVQTGKPLAEPVAVPSENTLPPDLGAGNVVRIETALGPVNVIFTKLRDLPQ